MTRLKSRPKLRPDLDWVRTRRRLLRAIKTQVRRRLGAEPEEIRRYTRHLDLEFKERWKPSDKRELMRAVESADLIFGGDFHAFGQAQRTHLKILKALRPSKRLLILALEAVDIRHQKHLDAYVEGRLTEREFLRKVRWAKEWGFPWENYKPLLEFVAKGKHRAIALGSSAENATLKEREQVAARRLAEVCEEADKAKPRFYIIFGELHLAPRHLPGQVRTRLKQAKLKNKLSQLTIHLNSERLYFDLAEKGLEAGVDVLKLDDSRFCVLASPPWVQWQSYLMYLEHSHDVDLDDGGFRADDMEFDYTDQVTVLIHLAAQDLGLSFKCDDISVYTAADERMVAALKNSLSQRDWRIATQLVEAGRSFFIPQGGILFLSRSTVNHAAELAGHYIHSRLSKRKRPLWNMPRDFRALIWSEAVGFFVSKLVNHKRQSETLPDLKARLAALSPRDQGREALLIALEQRLGELLNFYRGRQRMPRLKPRKRSSWLEAARLLGGMMGERLYLNYRSRNISVQSLLKMMQVDPSAPGFAAFYDDVVKRLGPGTGALRTRKERL